MPQLTDYIWNTCRQISNTVLSGVASEPTKWKRKRWLHSRCCVWSISIYRTTTDSIPRSYMLYAICCRR